jgi:hypothetical protein
MANLSTLYTDIYVAGTLAARTLVPSSGCVTNDSIEALAGIDFTKVVQKFPVRYSQKHGTAIVDEAHTIHIAAAAGIIVAIDVSCTVAPTTTDTIEVDIQKGNTAGVFSTILGSVVTLDNTSVERTVYPATISDDVYADDDSFAVVVDATGTSAQGLIVTVWFAEQPV